MLRQLTNIGKSLGLELLLSTGTILPCFRCIGGTFPLRLWYTVPGPLCCRYKPCGKSLGGELPPVDRNGLLQLSLHRRSSPTPMIYRARACMLQIQTMWEVPGSGAPPVDRNGLLQLRCTGGVPSTLWFTGPGPVCCSLPNLMCRKSPGSGAPPVDQHKFLCLFAVSEGSLYTIIYRARASILQIQTMWAKSLFITKVEVISKEFFSTQGNITVRG